MKKLAQNLLEYALILALIAVIGATVFAKFNLKIIKNYVFDRPVDSSDNSKIKIEAMTK